MKLTSYSHTCFPTIFSILVPTIFTSEVFETETDFQLQILANISLGCNFYFFLVDVFTSHHKSLINYILLLRNPNAVYQSVILPAGLKLPTNNTNNSPLVRNYLSAKNSDLNSYHFHTLRNLQVSKCSFNLLSDTTTKDIITPNYNWRALKNHVWFNECSSRNPCYHFTISLNNLISMDHITESVNVAMNLLGQSSPIHHFIITNSLQQVLKVCSSSTMETQTVIQHNITSNNSRNAFLTTPCSSPRIIRFTNFEYIAANFKEMFESFRHKDRKIFRVCSTTEVFWHFQLSIKLNASLRIVNVPIPPLLIHKLFENEADISLGFPYNPANAKLTGYSSQPIALDKFIFFTRLPQKIPPTMDFLIKPYGLLVWLCILSSIVISALFTLSVTLLHFGNVPNHIVHLRWLLVLLVEQSQTFASHAFKRSGVRLIVGVWLCCGIVFTTTYKGRLISILLNPELDMPPRTFEQLISHPEYVINSPGYPNASGLQADLNSSATPIAKVLMGRIQGLNTEEAVSTVSLNLHNYKLQPIL